MLYFLLSLFSLSMTYLVKEYSLKKALFDIPNHRSSHSVPTPHGGGVAIVLTWFTGISTLYYYSLIEPQLYYALLVGAIISIVSYIDDVAYLGPVPRLSAQIFVSAFGLYFLGGFESLDFGLFSIQNPIITNIFAFVLIIWFINLYNFLDGIDGYAGSEAIFLSLAAFVFFGGEHFLILIASVSGFLFWNWHRAKIFMGDVGSTLLGYTFAIFTLYYGNSNSLSFWIFITLFTLFWFDATLTLLRRLLNSEKIMQAHKKHAYQRATQYGHSHSSVVMISLLLNLVIFLFIYFIANVFLALLLSMLLIYFSIRYIDTKKPFF